MGEDEKSISVKNGMEEYEDYDIEDAYPLCWFIGYTQLSLATGIFPLSFLAGVFVRFLTCIPAGLYDIFPLNEGEQIALLIVVMVLAIYILWLSGYNLIYFVEVVFLQTHAKQKRYPGWFGIPLIMTTFALVITVFVQIKQDFNFQNSDDLDDLARAYFSFAFQECCNDDISNFTLICNETINVTTDCVNEELFNEAQVIAQGNIDKVCKLIDNYSNIPIDRVPTSVNTLCLFLGPKEYIDEVAKDLTFELEVNLIIALVCVVILGVSFVVQKLHTDHLEAQLDKDE